MKKLLNKLWLGKYIILLLTLVIGLTGLTFGYYFSSDNSIVNFYFRLTDESVVLNEEKLVSQENIDEVKNITQSWYTGSNISNYNKVEISNLMLTKTSTGYLITCNGNSFNIESNGEYKYNPSVAKGFLRHLVFNSLDQDVIDDYNSKYTETTSQGKTIKGISKIFDVDYYNSTLDENGNLLVNSDYNRIFTSLRVFAISFLSGFILSIILVLILSRYNKLEERKYYDNNRFYKTPFHKSFFKSSLVHFKSVKSLSTMAILLSMVMVCKFIPLPSGFGQLGISLGFIFLAVSCMIHGPIPALIIGLLSDVIGFLLKPSGVFFPGYTFNAMMACFTYALCFYKTHITYSRVLLARIVVNLIVNSIFGSIWWGIINNLSADATFTYALVTSIPKNVAYLIPQTTILFIIFIPSVRLFKQIGYLDSETNISLF